MAEQLANLQQQQILASKSKKPMGNGDKSGKSDSITQSKSHQGDVKQGSLKKVDSKTSAAQNEKSLNENGEMASLAKEKPPLPSFKKDGDKTNGQDQLEPRKSKLSQKNTIKIAKVNDQVDPLTENL